MNDMSEEKECKTCENCEHKSNSSEEFCGACGAGVESNWKEAGWRKDERIKSLESRLEAEIKLRNVFIKSSTDLAAKNIETEKRLSQAEADVNTLNELLRDKGMGQGEIDNLAYYENRLSHLMDEKAELNKKCESLALELDGHKVAMGCVTADEKASMGFWGRSCARLSIKNKLLMDVAGKMAGALKPFARYCDMNLFTNVKDGVEEFTVTIYKKESDQAKLALAEWDGINGVKVN